MRKLSWTREDDAKSRTWQDWTPLSFLKANSGISSEPTGSRSGMHSKPEVTTMLDCFMVISMSCYMFIRSHCYSYSFLFVSRCFLDKPPGPIRNSQFLKDNGQPRAGMKRGKLPKDLKI